MCGNPHTCHRHPTLPVRRSIRLPHVDYSQRGTYFLTICTFNKSCLFGRITNNIITLNHVGKIAQNSWLAIPSHFQNVRLSAFVVMPNHLHGILSIKERARHAVPLQIARSVEDFQRPVAASIPTIVRSFKAAVTKQARSDTNSPAFNVWQSNYFERILRNATEIKSATRYVIENPSRWMVHSRPPAHPSLARHPPVGARHAVPVFCNVTRPPDFLLTLYMSADIIPIERR